MFKRPSPTRSHRAPHKLGKAGAGEGASAWICEAVARKLRIQYEGALYHVINRGNYRRDVFGAVGAAEAFEQTVAETCLRYRWRLHAYVMVGAGKSIDDAANSSTDAPWKIAIAARLRHHGVPYRWLGRELQMGATNAIRAHVFRFRQRRTP